MALEPSVWRTNDAVQFDVARESISAATATLFELADREVVELAYAVAEARDIRVELLSIDGFDRQALDDFIDRVGQRVARVTAGEK